MTWPIPSSGGGQRAIELYHEALGVAAEEQKASIHGRLGELLLEIRQYAAAANEAEAMLKKDPKNCASHDRAG